jgi:putative FmdB family regulatory protein
MPLYEYACESCGQRFERIRKFSDPPLETCPLCGAGPVHKLVSSPAIQFKGSGFYITDYGRKGEAPTSGEGKPAKSTEGNKESTTPAETKEARKTSDSTESAKPASTPPSTPKTEK